MDLHLSEEHEMIRRMAREFAQKEVAPIAAEIDEQGRVPMDNVRKMGELGFLGLMVPEAYGGAGADTVAYAIAIEEIARVCASTAAIVSVQNSLVCQGFESFGDEEQKRTYLPRLARGEALGAFALTEPEAGCDAGALRSTARREGDAYVLNGTKHFITNGAVADVVLVFALTDPPAGSRGISAFVVEKGTPGFGVGREENKMGIRGTSTCELIFQDCRVPASQRLGAEGQGLRIALALLDGGRIGIAAQAVGIAQGAFEAALQHAKSRQQFGQTIGSFQAIQWMLADMSTRIEAARLLTYQAALARDAARKTGARYSREAAQAKLFASETAVWVTNRAEQIHGGYGYMKEYPVERYYRDAKITEIYEGTSEVQRMVIAGALLR